MLTFLQSLLHPLSLNAPFLHIRYAILLLKTIFLRSGCVPDVCVSILPPLGLYVSGLIITSSISTITHWLAFTVLDAEREIRRSSSDQHSDRV